MTYREIAEKHGVTYQAVAMAIRTHNPSCFKGVTKKQCIYPNLRAWMNENKVSQIELLSRMHLTVGGYNSERIRGWLRGEHDPRKTDIDLLIKITGLTYEKLFEEETK